MQFTPAADPETIGQQFIRSLKLYFKSFLHVFFFALILSIIAFTPRIIALLTNYDMLLNPSPFAPEKLFFVLIDIGSLILFTAMLWRIKCLIIARHETTGEDLKTAIKKIPLILIAVIIQLLLFSLINIVSLGFYLLAGQTSAGSSMSHWIVGGAFVAQFCAIFYIYYLFYFYLPLILTENEGAFSSLKKSAVLVWRNWWRTCVVQILPWACYLIFLVIVREAFKLNLHIYFIDNYSPTIGITCLQILLFALFIPWPAATLLVQLRDLELRKNF